MTEYEPRYNPLDEEHVEQVAGTKPRGLEKEIHESALPPTGVLELDLEQYVGDFNERIIGAYAAGTGEQSLPADVGVARSLIPPGTGALRDFSYIAPEIPRFDRDKCVGCMSCVTECPDTAILGKAIPKSHLEAELSAISDSQERDGIRAQWAVTRKYYEVFEKKGEEGALFGIFVDPTKCKGCAECVEVCDALGYHALAMIKKDEQTIPRYRSYFNFFRQVGPTPRAYINERALADMMLSDEALLYVAAPDRAWGAVRRRRSE